MKEKTILDTLADAARARVEENKKKKPMEVLKKEAKSLAADTGFPFEKALVAPGISVICEVKKASPSKGLIAVDFRIWKSRGSMSARAHLRFPC